MEMNECIQSVNDKLAAVAAPSSSDADAAALQAQLNDLKVLLLLQNQLLQEQTREIIAQKARMHEAQREIDVRDQRIARLERHLALKDQKAAAESHPKPAAEHQHKSATLKPPPAKEAPRKIAESTSTGASRATTPQPPKAPDPPEPEVTYLTTDRVYGFVPQPVAEKEEVKGGRVKACVGAMGLSLLFFPPSQSQLGANRLARGQQGWWPAPLGPTRTRYPPPTRARCSITE